MTDRMLIYRVRRLLGRRRTLAEIARHLDVTTARIYRAWPEVRYRFGSRPRIGTPPISLALQAFASYFGEFVELRDGVSREARTAPPSASSGV